MYYLFLFCCIVIAAITGFIIGGYIGLAIYNYFNKPATPEQVMKQGLQWNKWLRPWWRK